MKNKKLWTTFLVFILFLFVLKAQALATLSINEFASDTAGTLVDPDWAEIYNSGTSSIDLSEYRLEDLNATNKKTLSGTVGSSSFITFDWSNKLNKAGDVISLVKISDSSLIDRVGYGDQGTDVSAPAQGQSAGRSTDGTGDWVIFSVPTKGSTNNTSSPSLTPTPTPVPTNTPTPNPTSSPTPTRSPAPTKTPTPIPTPTKSPISIVLLKSNLTPTPKPTTAGNIFPSSVLGGSTESAAGQAGPTINKPFPKPTFTPKVKVLGSKNSNLSKIFISIGIIFLISCGILVARSYLRNKDEKAI